MESHPVSSQDEQFAPSLRVHGGNLIHYHSPGQSSERLPGPSPSRTSHLSGNGSDLSQGPSGGVDGVDLMERGTPEQVRETIRRHILETNAIQTGGMFVASSSEINPPIKPENFRAMVEAVGEINKPTTL